MPNLEATARKATARTWHSLINSGRAERGNDTATVELGGQGRDKWGVRLSVTINGVADDPVTVYAGDSWIVALHFFNKTCRQARLSGFQGQLVEESDGSGLMDGLPAQVMTSEALDCLREWLGVDAEHGEVTSS